MTKSWIETKIVQSSSKKILWLPHLSCGKEDMSFMHRKRKLCSANSEESTMNKWFGS